MYTEVACYCTMTIRDDLVSNGVIYYRVSFVGDKSGVAWAVI